MLNIPKTIVNIGRSIEESGGKLYIVGGASIDILNNKIPKDWDLECFMLDWDQLIATINSKVDNIQSSDLIGSKFGILKLKVDSLDIEIGLPRRDSKIGIKHKDFMVSVDKTMTIKEAASRRDFTINAIYIDSISSQIIDPYNGAKHLAEGLLHYIDKDKFLEDPLRIMRAVQIASRKCNKISPGLASLIKENCFLIKDLSGDAVLGELTKFLMLGINPTIGMDILSLMFGAFPKLEALASCKQSAKWHPEGNVWNHTKLVINEAFKYREEIPEEWRLAFMFGMLLHDIGKPETQDPVRLTTINHEIVGLKTARVFMERLTNNQDLIDKVLSIIKYHMKPKYMSPKHMEKWRRMHNICPLSIVAYVCMCDGNGRGFDNLGKNEPTFIKVMKIYESLGKPKGRIKPVLQGRHLIEAGHKPGPEFGKLLAKAYEYQLRTGCTDIQELLNATNK